MVLTIALLFLAGLIAYLLLMPLELCIDSYRQRYYLRLGFLARAMLEKDPLEVVRLHVKVLFMNFSWRPSDMRSWKVQKKRETKKKKDHRKPGMPLTRVKRLIRTFKVRAFRLEVDTGDPMLNARLYPVCFLLSQRFGDIQINFRDRNHLLLEAVNRPIYILNAFINL